MVYWVEEEHLVCWRREAVVGNLEPYLAMGVGKIWAVHLELRWAGPLKMGRTQMGAEEAIRTVAVAMVEMQTAVNSEEIQAGVETGEEEKQAHFVPAVQHFGVENDLAEEV